MELLRSDRRQARRFGLPRDFNVDEPASGVPDPSDRLILAEQVARLRSWLDGLPEADRDLVLARFEKRSTKPSEMARQLGVSSRTIKRRGHAAWGRFLRLHGQEERGGGDL